MNYLAHISLSGDDPLVMVGNLIGDMVSNKGLEQLHPSVQEGVALHRMIDSFTDNHPDVRGLNRIFRPTQRKYAPVVTDILMDHILASHWTKWDDRTYPVFCEATYRVIDAHHDSMPLVARKRIISMVDGRWLHSYASASGIRYALSRLSVRARFDNRIGQAYDVYRMNQEKADLLFESFFPQIRKAAMAFRTKRR